VTSPLRESEFRRYVATLGKRDCALLRRILGERWQHLGQAASKKKTKPGHPPRTYTTKELLTITRALEKGRSVRAIARRLKMPHATLARMVARENIREQIADDKARRAKGGAWQRRKRRKHLTVLGVDLGAVERQEQAAHERVRRISGDALGRAVHQQTPKERRAGLRKVGLDLDALEHASDWLGPLADPEDDEDDEDA
jgi:hypothetical protein